LTGTVTEQGDMPFMGYNRYDVSADVISTHHSRSN